MSRLEIYKKQAKQLVRWHREGNHSIGGRIRGLARYKTLTDREALALPFPLREAQEIIAVEAGHASWAALKAAVARRANAGQTDIVCAATHARRADHLRRQRAGIRRVLQGHAGLLHRLPARPSPLLRRCFARRRLRASEIRTRARVRHRHTRPRRFHHGLHRSGERQGALCQHTWQQA